MSAGSRWATGAVVLESNAWTRSATLAKKAVLAAAVAAGLLGTALSAVPSSASTAQPGVLDAGLSVTGTAAQRVVVSGAHGAMAAVRAAVTRVGGTVRAPLPIIDGVSATVPADRLAELTGTPGVKAVTADRAGKLYAASWDDTTSSSSYVWTSQAGNAFQAGNRGAGVSVAVLDTGVAAVNDLAGRVMAGPDLSGENANTVDSYGHGTVMAGIIAGSGVDAGSSPRTGIAPAAKIISVKVAGASGATDVSTVLAGLSWVNAFKADYNIKVLNLSWGVPSTQSPSVDPLNYAVEQLWAGGVTVVVAAGNTGGQILKPADDPLVITAGAFDDRGDINTDNDVVPNWSSVGPTAQGAAKPDLVAPGRTVVATRSPGSTVERDNPKALIAPSYIKGSGTSEAAAVTSGAAALLIAKNPAMTPDQVKAALTSTALPIPSLSRNSQGAGRLQIMAAMAKDVSGVASAVPTATGTGTLQASRGSAPSVTVKCNGVDKVLNDETTSWCSAWSSSAWTSSAWTSSAWTSSAWTSSAWTSSAWTSSAWTSSAWTSSAWTSSAWTSAAWTSSAWTSSAWTSAVYESEDTFLDAFWGHRPKWYQNVPGEQSDGPPSTDKHDLVVGNL
ncbi:MAG: serine protease AprX [Actinomycetota bacterium]|jgi:serine protease AprX|nr:serine protease AprX [Actinomycetota bacterium]